MNFNTAEEKWIHLVARAIVAVRSLWRTLRLAAEIRRFAERSRVAATFCRIRNVLPEPEGARKPELLFRRKPRSQLGLRSGTEAEGRSEAEESELAEWLSEGQQRRRTPAPGGKGKTWRPANTSPRLGGAE